MSRHHSILAGMTCCVSLTLALATSASACEPNPQRPPIRVSVGTDGKPVVTPDTVNACVDETIHWVFQGGAKEFAVSFTGADGSPFDWNERKGASVTGTVRPGAVKGQKPTPYKYNVEVDGKVLDPQIIVDP
jgi:hypothetical protein